MTSEYDDIGRRSIYQNIQLFIRSKNDILNVAKFKHSLHKIRTSSSAVAALQDGLFLAKSGRLELGDKIYGHYSPYATSY